MKNEKKPIRNKRFLLHILQQAAAFGMVFGVAFLALFSFVMDDSAMRHFDIFSEEEHFEDTDVFDQMLVNSLYSIIRYNVAKSQMEENGSFDGSKEIDIVAFANRKTGETSDSGIHYTLEDLLKWNQYGMDYAIEDYTLTQFLDSYDDNPLFYNGTLSESQKNALRSKFMDEKYVPVDRIYYEEGATDADAEEQPYTDAEVLNGASDGKLVIESDAGSTSYYFSNSDEAAESDITYVDENTSETESDYLNGYQGDTLFEALLQGNSKLFPNEPYGWYRSFREQVQALAVNVMNYGDAIEGIYIDSSTNTVHVLLPVLVERYKTVDGFGLQDYADNLSEYVEYCTYLEQTISDLSYNYREYLHLKDAFGNGNTNIQFYFRMMMLGDRVEVSNLVREIPLDNMDNYFKTSCGKYVIYKPQNISLDTNTHILTVEEMFEAFSSYEYAYPDTAKMWIGVDTSYPVEDDFKAASETYNTFRKYRMYFVALAASCALIYGILFLYLSVRAGRVKDSEGNVTIRLTWIDQIPTEIYLLFGALVMAVIYVIAVVLDSWYSDAYVAQYREQVMYVAAVIGTVISSLLCALWYSFIRRCKKGYFWKGSLLYFFWNKTVKKFFAGIKKTALYVYDNAGALAQAVFLFGGVMVYNFLAGVILALGRFGINFIAGVIAFVLVPDALAVYGWYHNRNKKKRLIDGIHEISEGNLDYQIDTRKLHGENLEIAQAINNISDSINAAVATSMKDEKLKADLITNVSHDIKTPLTSIINYVDLLKRENIETQPVKGYIEVLDQKSQRLKHLTEDLVEASKISSGNIVLHMEKIDLIELLHQTVAEFSDKLEEKKLSLVDGFSGESVYIEADGRRIYRVVENLFGNICKYAMPETRVYIDRELTEDDKYVILCLKNISSQPMNIRAEELTERFIRGDVSRSTEGSGLGLSIAKNLTELQNGKFDIYLDGDLFKVSLKFPVYEEKE